MVSDVLTDDLRDTLEVFATASDPREPLTTTDVAERLDVSRERSSARLETLTDRGFLKTKPVGTRDRIWWRPPEPVADTEQSFSALVANVPGMIYQCRNEAGWPMAFVSAGCRQLTGYEPEALEAGRISYGDDIIHPDDVEHVWETVQEGLEDDGRFTIQYRIRTADGETRWVWERGRAVSDDADEPSVLEGLITDITELKTQARHLEREIDEVFERVDDAFYALDTDFRFTYVNDRAEELLQHTEADLLGESVWEMFPEATETPAWESFHEALDTQEPTGYELYYEPLEFWVEANVYPSETGLSVYFRDVTERKEREQTLREERDRFNALFESVPEAVVHVRFEGDEPIIRNVNPEFEAVFGYSREDLIGASLNEHIVPERFADEAARLDEAIASLERIEREVVRETADAEREFLFRGVPFPAEGETIEGVGVYVDITEQKEREQYLREAKTRLEAATAAGAVGTWEWHIPDDRMVTGASFARLFGVDPEAAREGVSLDRFVSAIHGDDRERVERAVDEAVESCGEYREEYRVRDADGDLRWVTARGHVECDEDGEPVRFPGALVDITERKEAERELERQREQLAALNELHGVVREINEALVRQSTREEVEQVVCEQLAASDSYLFAWIGEVEPHGDGVRVRTEAGSGGYVDSLEISIAPDDPTSQGPTGRAIRMGEMQVVQDVTADPAYDQWRDRATEYGFRSSAAIPIAYEGTRYGVLNVYAARPYAFGDSEREVIGQLGEVVGHAINAIERKQALMSDELVELEFVVHGVFDDLGISGPDEGRITIDQAIPLGEEEFLVYGTTTGDAFEALAAFADQLPNFEEPTVVTETPEESRYKVRLTEPPSLSAIAAHGGRIQTAAIEDGDYRLTAELPPDIDVRRITEAVRDIYPTAEVVAQRQITQDDRALQLRETLAEGVTDRQRTALQSAYHAGFFEWPRESTGEEVAASMDIAPATFHQHLRAGQKKLLRVLFGEEPALA